MNSQCVVMVFVANKQEKFTTIMTLELIVTIVKRQKLDRMPISLKHYIALVSQKNIKQKQNT